MNSMNPGVHVHSRDAAMVADNKKYENVAWSCHDDKESENRDTDMVMATALTSFHRTLTERISLGF